MPVLTMIVSLLPTTVSDIQMILKKELKLLHVCLSANTKNAYIFSLLTAVGTMIF